MSVLPSALDLTVQGGAHCTLRWANGRLVYYPDGWWARMSAAVEVMPSDAQWQAFWSALDRVGAWSWQGDYSAGVSCGTPWELVIERGGQTVRCSGNTWRAGATPARFREFIDALVELLGLPDTKLSWWVAE
jgi:hypothetical protein